MVKVSSGSVTIPGTSERGASWRISSARAAGAAARANGVAIARSGSIGILPSRGARAPKAAGEVLGRSRDLPAGPGHQLTGLGRGTDRVRGPTDQREPRRQPGQRVVERPPVAWAMLRCSRSGIDRDLAHTGIVPVRATKGPATRSRSPARLAREAGRPAPGVGADPRPGAGTPWPALRGRRPGG